ncbi:MAG: alkaline ceramidase [Fuerstiella sp.]|nr:alkaline ceramidase [Fuerstiella sp.]
MSSNGPRHFRHASFRGQIGIARTDITPAIGTYSRNWGAAEHDVADAVHRSLTLSVLTLASETEESPLIFIDADLGWWKTPQVFTEFHKRLLRELEVESSDLIFALSHTHAGPPLEQPDDLLSGSGLLKEWMETLHHRTVQAVRQAKSAQTDSILEWNTGRCQLATVRDLPDPDSSRNRLLCGFNPDGEADDTLLLGRITDSSGNIRATLVNYACHPTTLAWENTALSPDYPGAMRETMQNHTGAPAFFMLGICGDLAPRYQYVGDPSVADRHGRQLALAALSALEDMEPPETQLVFQKAVESGAPLAAWRHLPSESSPALKAFQTSVRLPLKDWATAEELEQQRLACDERAEEERLRRKRDIRRSIGNGPDWELAVHAWRIGDTVLVGCCCEPYSVLQQELRRQFPDRVIICMNLINGSIGYLPPADLYDTDVYPVWQTPFDRGSLELTLDCMTKAIRHVLNE